MHRLDIAQEPARRIFGVPHRGPYPEIGSAFDRLADLLAKHGPALAGREVIGVFHDDPAATAPDALRSHAGVVVEEDLRRPPDLEELRLAGGRHAALRLTGSYAGLPDAYLWLFGEGLAAAGVRARARTSFEIYRNDPRDTAEADLITDIFVPLA